MATVGCSASSTLPSITVRWTGSGCVGAPAGVTIFSAVSSPCVTAADGQRANEVTFQVCSANNTLVCPVTQVFPAGTAQGPPTAAASLGCSDISIASAATAAPVEQGTDYAFPGKCYALSNSTGSVQYYCGINTVPPVYLNGTDPCTPVVAACPPSVLGDMSTWYKLRNDTCNCPWNCIDCHGNGVPTNFPDKTLAEEHRCSCSSTTSTVDCRGCSASGCGSGSTCDTTVFLTTSKTYQCRPDEVLQQFFAGGGLFVWSIQFASSSTTTGGNASLSCYANQFGTPLLFTCQFGRCERSVDNNRQKVKCLDTYCNVTGGGDEGLDLVVLALSGESTVILDPSGRTEMFQQQAPVVVVMYCNASACQFPGEGGVTQSTLEIVLASVFGGLIVLLLVGAVLFCFWRDKRLQREYKDFGVRRIERSLQWSEIACTLRFFVPAKKFHRTRKVLEVLKPMSGAASPGSMTALMGESGSGKTALLDMLARRKTFGEMHGDVLVNGRVPRVEWKRITGYVLQDDVFLPTQTAREHLRFVSRLKLPANMRTQDRDAQVERVLSLMHLIDVADSQIGDARRKGLSGGEKKRLAIASELVSDPAILFLDEPTSGLDSVNAFRVMRCLHELAHERGKTIIFAIHSPDSALFQLFTNVIILAKGHLMYSGTRDNLQPAMEKLSGRPCPQMYNPADFAIHVIAEIPENELAARATISSVSVGEAVPALAVSERKRAAEASDFTHIDDAVFESGMVDMDTMQQEQLAAREQIAASVEESDRLGAYNQSWLFQTLYVMQRSLADSWRNPYLLRLQYFLILAAALVLGGMFFQMGFDLVGAQNRAGLLFFVNSFLMIVTLPSIDTFHAERTVFLREKGAGYYKPSAYFVAKALADIIPLRLLPPIIFSIVVYPMAGLRGPINYYFWFMLVSILISYCATGMCLLISSLSPSVAVGNLVAIIVMMFMLLFGGLLLNNSTLPPGLAWIKWLSYINFAFSAMMINEFTNLTFFGNFFFFLVVVFFFFCHAFSVL